MTQEDKREIQSNRRFKEMRELACRLDSILEEAISSKTKIENIIKNYKAQQIYPVAEPDFLSRGESVFLVK